MSNSYHDDRSLGLSPDPSSGSNNKSNEVFAGGATTSQHIDAEDDDHFNNTTFKLKRTRSIGLLDEFISPMERAKREAEKQEQQQSIPIQSLGPDDTNIDDPNDKPTHNTSKSNDLNDHNAPNDEQKTDENDEQELTKRVSASFTSPEFIPLDDTDIAIEPSRHVDYFSHQWDVSDISKSWRYVIQKRKDVANSARLENASWRTWAQRRTNLKTINPEELNWSKENDITWLYGPIVNDDPESDDEDDNHDHHEDHHKHSSNTVSSAVAGDISIPNPSMKRKKGILKKRSVEDVMISHANLVKLEAMENRLKAKKEKQKEQLRKYYERTHKRTPSNEPPEFDDFDAISEKLNTQYRIPSNQNSAVDLTNLNKSPNDLASLDTQSPSGISNTSADEMATNVSNLDLAKKSTNDSNNYFSDSKSIGSGLKRDRHIHFNDVVEQCIAVDYIEDDQLNSDFDSEEVDDEEDYYDDDNSTSNSTLRGSNSYMFSDPSSSGANSIGDSEAEKEEADDEDDEDEDDDDDDGGFFLKVKSPSGTTSAPPLVNKEKQKQEIEEAQRQLAMEHTPSSQKTDDTSSISTNSSKVYRTIQLLPSTSLNYGSDEESSDEENPYTSSLSHNVNNSSSRGYDYYYDYNTVYTVDPAHGIYGNNKDDGNSPDVVDLPQDLAKYSNFDTLPSEQEGNQNPPIIDSQVISNNNYIYNNDSTTHQPASSSDSNASSPGVQSPLFSAYSGSHPDRGMNLNLDSKHPHESAAPTSTFDLNGEDSESDSDSDEGLSISTRSSSQSLAQLVFTHNMTPMTNQSQNSETGDSHYPSGFDPSPMEGNISDINPRHSSTGLSKQGTSSNSLSDQFFGTTPLTKDNSSSTLADQFFNKQPAKVTSPPVDKKYTTTSSSPYGVTGGSIEGSPRSASPRNTLPKLAQSKASPLPPHTTSANAFLGNTTPPLEKQQRKPSGTFDFGNSDSESDSEDDQFVGDIESPSVNQNINSYNSLSQVAGRNGISSPNPDEINLSDPIGQVPRAPESDRSNSPAQDKNLVNQAKGLATHLLGNWKHDQSN